MTTQKAKRLWSAFTAHVTSTVENLEIRPFLERWPTLHSLPSAHFSLFESPARRVVVFLKFSTVTLDLGEIWLTVWYLIAWPRHSSWRASLFDKHTELSDICAPSLFTRWPARFTRLLRPKPANSQEPNQDDEADEKSRRSHDDDELPVKGRRRRSHHWLLCYLHSRV